MVFLKSPYFSRFCLGRNLRQCQKNSAEQLANIKTILFKQKRWCTSLLPKYPKCRTLQRHTRRVKNIYNHRISETLLSTSNKYIYNDRIPYFFLHGSGPVASIGCFNKFWPQMCRGFFGLVEWRPRGAAVGSTVNCWGFGLQICSARNGCLAWDDTRCSQEILKHLSFHLISGYDIYNIYNMIWYHYIIWLS